MAAKHKVKTVLISLTLAILVLGVAQTAAALRADVAMFYEPLAAYGNWVDYGNYGPVWYPTNVPSDWRPYLNGRWVPAAEGWVFESEEPWAWAGYHYGNWFPTQEYG